MNFASLIYFAGSESFTRSVLGQIELSAPTASAALETLFRNLNMDSRPNGKTERSLSVGDLIYLIDADSGHESWHLVAPVGFVRVSRPAQFRIMSEPVA